MSAATCDRCGRAKCDSPYDCDYCGTEEGLRCHGHANAQPVVSEPTERIVAAALKHAGTGLIYMHEAPGRHHNVLWSLAALNHNDNGMDQGFVTSAGRFVHRDEAFTIAENAGQLIARHREGELFSEDLW